MGIGGQGISAVAQMALVTGSTVTGCDQQASATTRALEHAGIAVHIGHSPQHLANVDALIFVPAVVALNPHNPELLAAKARGMQVITWQEMLGQLMLGKCALSVSGVHGKGTTTAMLALMLVDAGLDPTCEIGAIVPRFGVNYRLGNSHYFLNEADEFNHNFWHYHPRLVIVTSIEFEHPEFFPDYPAFLAAFEHFIRGMDIQGTWPLPPTLILNADSPGCLELLDRLKDSPARVILYSLEKTHVPKIAPPAYNNQGEYQAYDVKLDGETSFRVRSRNDTAFPTERVIHLQLPGAHNIQNALAAITAARTLDIDPNIIVQTLESFGGIKRRFEIRHQGPLHIAAQTLDIILIDDYAHHPTAIASTLEAAHRLYPGRRLVAVYQPHMFSRTQTFFEQFLHAFDAADITIIADIFPGREHDTGLIHARDLVDAMEKCRTDDTGAGPVPLPGSGVSPEIPSSFSPPAAARQILHGGNVQATAQIVKNILQSGDVVLIMGAGDIYTVTEIVLQELT